jgi:hypothetical protein
MNPTKRLELFEKKHGDYYDMLSQIDPDINKPGQRELRRNMERHNKLVYMCIGYSIGIAEREKV